MFSSVASWRSKFPYTNFRFSNVIFSCIHHCGCRTVNFHMLIHSFRCRNVNVLMQINHCRLRNVGFPMHPSVVVAKYEVCHANPSLSAQKYIFPNASINFGVEVSFSHANRNLLVNHQILCIFPHTKVTGYPTTTTTTTTRLKGGG